MAMVQQRVHTQKLTVQTAGMAAGRRRTTYMKWLYSAANGENEKANCSIEPMD